MISELVSIENELIALRLELLTQSADLESLRERSQSLSQRLVEAEQRVLRLQRESRELSELVSQLRLQLRESRDAYDELSRISNARIGNLTRENEELRKERNQESQRADLLQRTRWIWAGAGATVGVLVVTLANSLVR